MDFLKWHIQPKAEDEKEKSDSCLYQLEQERIYAEKAKLKQYWVKSREYRIMLQEYSQELGEKEEAAKKRIEEKQKRLDEKERFLNEREKRLAEDKDCARAYMAALRKTEITIIDWIKRMESRERSVFEEIRINSDKAQMYSKEMSGFDFEYYVAELMSKNGFINVTVTPKSHDWGADITAEKDQIRYVVQCKYYTSLVGVEAVQQIYSAKTHYNAHVCVVASNNLFTKAANVLANQLNVLLWDGEFLSKLREEGGAKSGTKADSRP